MTNHYIIGLSQDSDTLRFGYTDQKVFLYNQARDRTLIQGVNKFILMMNSYIESFSKVQMSDLTVGHQKDLFISLAIGKTIRCCQTIDSLYDTLTPHSEKFWKQSNAHFQVWGSPPLDFIKTNQYSAPEGYYGVAGSLGFYLFKYLPNIENLSPLDIISKAVDIFWTDLNIDPALSAKQIHNKVLEKININNINFKAYEVALKYIWDKPGIDPSISNIIYDLRSWGIQPEDLTNLKQKILFSNLNPSVLKALTQLQTFINYSLYNNFPLDDELNIPNVNPTTFETISKNILKISNPSGMALVYQVLAISGLVKAAKVLTNVQPQILKSKYYDYIKYSNNVTLFTQVADNLATTYDAYGALAFEGTLTEARGLSYFAYQKALEFISYDTSLTVPFNNNNSRLTGFL